VKKGYRNASKLFEPKAIIKLKEIETMSQISDEKSELRWNAEIGMFCLDRSRATCKWKASYCAKHCFNNKLYVVFVDMKTKDPRNDRYWNRITGKQLNIELNRKHKQTERVRFMTRGEALNNLSGIDRIIDICNNNLNRLFWLPTRAWRDRAMKAAIEQKLFKIKNLRVQASLDPSNSIFEINQLIVDGWSTMFFGNDGRSPIENSIKCKKTWDKKHSYCPQCKKGCFTKKQVHVWLKEH